MNRRSWLKTVAVGGASAALVGSWRWSARAAPSAVFVVTDRPREAARRATQAAGLRAYEVEASVRPIAPTPTDLTVLRAGKLVDPHRDTGLADELVAYASDLRRTPSTGKFLVTIEPVHRSDRESVVFECDGQVIERVSRGATFCRIVIPGHRGDTVFALDDGLLSVVSSSCRHEICKKSGRVSSGRIICAPNRLVATISGPPKSVDAVTS